MRQVFITDSDFAFPTHDVFVYLVKTENRLYASSQFKFSKIALVGGIGCAEMYGSKVAYIYIYIWIYIYIFMYLLLNHGGDLIPYKSKSKGRQQL